LVNKASIIDFKLCTKTNHFLYNTLYNYAPVMDPIDPTLPVESQAEDEDIEMPDPRSEPGSSAPGSPAPPEGDPEAEPVAPLIVTSSPAATTGKFTLSASYY